MSLLTPVLGFAVTVFALSALSRWISLQVQLVGYRLTGDERAAVIVYYLLMLPGILLHELSHAAMAILLGLKVGKFTLGPRAQGRYVQLGSVTVTSGGTLRDSLVGLAPFLSGTVILLLLGYQVFDVGALGQAWINGGWREVLQSASGMWHVQDFWIWAYLVFAISNSMTPSPADRQPWLMAALYIGLALVVAYVLGLLAVATDALAPQAAGALSALTLTFLFTLALDLVAAAVLLVTEFFIVALRSSPGR
jgi:hypothetical protein